MMKIVWVDEEIHKTKWRLIGCINIETAGLRRDLPLEEAFKHQATNENLNGDPRKVASTMSRLIG